MEFIKRSLVQTASGGGPNEGLELKSRVHEQMKETLAVSLSTC